LWRWTWITSPSKSIKVEEFAFATFNASRRNINLDPSSFKCLVQSRQTRKGVLHSVYDQIAALAFLDQFVHIRQILWFLTEFAFVLVRFFLEITDLIFCLILDILKQRGFENSYLNYKQPGKTNNKWISV
jgi:hypothetical protein